MAIEIVSFPIKHGGSFHSYVSLPEATIGLTIIMIVIIGLTCLLSLRVGYYILLLPCDI